MNRYDQEFAALKARARELRAKPPKQGLGDRVHAVVGPAVHKVAPWWPCFKNRETSELKPASLCGYIRQTLNKISS
jgi:hypothetical protein